MLPIRGHGFNPWLGKILHVAWHGRKKKKTINTMQKRAKCLWHNVKRKKIQNTKLYLYNDQKCVKTAMQEVKGYAIIKPLSWIFWFPTHPQPGNHKKLLFFIVLFSITAAFKIVIQQLENPTNKTLQNKRFQLKKILKGNQSVHKKFNHLSSWLKKVSPDLRQIQYHCPESRWTIWFTSVR